jgi:hypothetical protein
MEEHKKDIPPTEKNHALKEPVTKRLKRSISQLPNKKQYLELFTAALSIPLMITVLMLNVGNLRQNKTTPLQTPIISTSPVALNSTPTVSPVPSVPITANPSNPVCTKEVGPVKISLPEEGSIVIENPVCIEIQRPTGNYCEVAWSYRINTDPWSSYTDSTVCLYSLTPGKKRLEVRVKSIASSDQTLLQRTFTVQEQPTPEATSSANQ